MTKLAQQCFAEFFGSMLIVVLGVGSVCSAVLTEALVGLWQVAAVWGFTVTIAITITSKISGAHLNPAVTAALATANRMPRKHAPAYVLAQLFGGIVGALVNFTIFYDFLQDDRTIATAMVFGDYFPNPALFPNEPNFISIPRALFIETWGTAILMFVILAATDSNQDSNTRRAAPAIIGFTVACLIAVYAPLTQAGWNPMRDLGPRLVALMIGYGTIAIPGPRYGFWLYTVGPIIGAHLGLVAYTFTIGKALQPGTELGEN